MALRINWFFTIDFTSKIWKFRWCQQIIIFGQIIPLITFLFYSSKNLRQRLETRWEVHWLSLWSPNKVPRSKVFYSSRAHSGSRHRRVHQADPSIWFPNWNKKEKGFKSPRGQPRDSKTPEHQLRGCHRRRGDPRKEDQYGPSSGPRKIVQVRWGFEKLD